MTAVRPRAPELFRLSSSDWDRFQSQILRFEAEDFHPDLRDDPSDLQRLIQSPTGIALGLRTEHRPLAGYIASDVLERFGDVPGVREDAHWGRGDTHYIAVVVVARELRHGGSGTFLTMECARTAFDQGFERVTAHVISGVSCKIDRRIRVLGSRPDWYGTGHAYEYIEITREVLQ